MLCFQWIMVILNCGFSKSAHPDRMILSRRYRQLMRGSRVMDRIGSFVEGRTPEDPANLVMVGRLSGFHSCDGKDPQYTLRGRLLLAICRRSIELPVCNSA